MLDGLTKWNDIRINSWWKDLKKRFFRQKAKRIFQPEEELFSFYAHQHRIITLLFQLHLTWLFGLGLALGGMSIYAWETGGSYFWAITPALLGLCLGAGCFQGYRSFLQYSENYRRMMREMHDAHYSDQRRITKNKPIEPLFLKLLRPKEHKQWDTKPCSRCMRSMELLVDICPHCGKEQEELLKN